MSIVTTPEERFEDVPDYNHPHERVPVTEDGAEMAYVDVPAEGDDADETFVLMHGEPTWGFLYRKLIPTLAERGRVIVPDMLGLGRSDKYTDPDAYSFDLHYKSFETCCSRNSTSRTSRWSARTGAASSDWRWPATTPSGSPAWCR